ncbi:MAG: ChaN family lipoprotein [Kofleriaceae bacterium]
MHPLCPSGRLGHVDVVSPRAPRAQASSAPRRARLVVALAAIASLAACGGAYRGAATPGGAQEPPRGVEAAALPYTILDGRTGRQLDAAEFWGRLGAARVVCVGEEHPNPHHHWAQLEVVTRLTPGAAHSSLALAMEMFQRPFQGVLDDFTAARIDESALLSRAGWSERWGYDFGLYRPILARMVRAGGHLVALNPAKELVKRISRQGLESLSPQERAELPELNLSDAAHRAWFDGVMAAMSGDAHGSPHRAEPAESSGGAAEGDTAEGGHAEGGHAEGGPAPAEPPAMPSAERVYTVQVLWDESMADGAARWVRAAPDHRAIVIAGNGHCHDSAVVARVKRRGISEAVSIRPIVDTGDDEVAGALARPMNDYLFVMTLPKPVP